MILPLLALLGLLPFFGICLSLPLTPRGSIHSPLPYLASDGFPSPSPPQLAALESLAHGSLPTLPPPLSISHDALVSLRLVNFAETIESVFFATFLSNITSRVPGFEIPAHLAPYSTYITDFLTSVTNTEELHSLDASGAISHFSQTPIEPCGTYRFDVGSFEEGIGLAVTLTSHVFGVLGDVAASLAREGDDPELVRHVLQVAAAEGEQNGFFRFLLGKTPQELPFTTPSSRAFAFTALQGFVDIDTCPNVLSLLGSDLRTYKPLRVVDTPGAADQQIRLGLGGGGGGGGDSWEEGKKYWVVYINQLHAPAVRPLTRVAQQDGAQSGEVIVQAEWPFGAFELNGLTVLAVVDEAGPFAGVTEVAEKAIWAPGFVVVN